ncbi:hypothetical protein C0J52_25548 [Blattella germanica]|nr:hypothetical protein C0J52_25548 [Blattella germanica]
MDRWLDLGSYLLSSSGARWHRQASDVDGYVVGDEQIQEKNLLETVKGTSKLKFHQISNNVRETASKNFGLSLGENVLPRAAASKVAEASRHRSHLFNQTSWKKEDFSIFSGGKLIQLGNLSKLNY